MIHYCIIKGHEDQKIQGLCLSDKCKTLSQFFCEKCLKKEHSSQDCQNKLCSYQDILKIASKQEEQVDSLIKFMEQLFQVEKNQLSQLRDQKKLLVQIKEHIYYEEFNRLPAHINLLIQLHPLFNNEKQNQEQLVLGDLLRDQNYLRNTLELINRTIASVKIPSFKKSFTQIYSLLNLQNWKEAEELSQECIVQLRKDLSVLQYLQCISLLEQNQIGKNIKLLNEAKSINPNFFSDIQDISNYELAINQNNIMAMNTLGYALHGSKKFDEAIQLLKKTIELDDNNYYGKMLKCSILSNLKNSACFEQDIDDIIRSKYQNSYALYLKAKLGFLQQERNLQEILVWLDESIKIDPTNAIAYGFRGDLLYKLNQWELAINNYEKSIQLDYQDISTYISIVQCFSYLGNHFDALNYIEKAIQNFPNDYLVYFQKGQILENLQYWDLAIEFYKYAANKNPKDKSIYIKIGDLLQTLKTRKQYERYALQYYDRQALSSYDNQAKLYYNKAIERDPNNWVPHFKIGQILESEDENQGAKEHYKVAIQKGGQDMNLFNRAISINEKLKDKKEVANIKKIWKQSQQNQLSF